MFPNGPECKSTRVGTYRYFWGGVVFSHGNCRHFLGGKNRLLSKGYSLEEIVGVVMEMEELKKSRAESLKLNGREKLTFAMDSAGRTLRKIVAGNGKRDGPNSVQARMA